MAYKKKADMATTKEQKLAQEIFAECEKEG